MANADTTYAAAFAEHYTHHIQTARDSIEGFRSVRLWVQANFVPVQDGKDPLTMEFRASWDPSNGRGNHQEIKFNGFRLSVQEMGKWTPFAVIFESHRLGRDRIMKVLADTTVKPIDLMYFVLLLMVQNGQDEYVMQQLLTGRRR